MNSNHSDKKNRFNFLPNESISDLSKFKANVAKMKIFVFHRVENIVEKGENIGKLIHKRQNFRLVQFEVFADDKKKCNPKIGICFAKDRKHCGDRRKCFFKLTAFADGKMMQLKN